jgi:inner membrane transporter RhtA
MTTPSVPRATESASGAAARAPAWSLAVLSMTLIQLGAALSTGLFSAVGPAGTAWLRLCAGGAMFLAFRRPRLRGRTRGELAGAVGLGVISGVMTMSFLSALARIPLGTTVAIEFLGPLTVAVLGTRRLRRMAWPVLALAGVSALTEPWTGAVDALGIAFAAVSGLGWGSYILLTARVGDRFEGLEGLSVTIPIAAVTATLVAGPGAIGRVTPPVMAAAVGLALLMPVIPYSLELLALRRLTTSAFGTLMALEPAIATVMGALVLAQVPTPLQTLGVLLVVVAGIGATRGGHRLTPAQNAAIATVE